MPEMKEIYKKYAVNYDELVLAEDYKKNLNEFFNNEIIWDNKIIYEAGIGTGRVTSIYIDKVKYCYGFDRENHMLKKCANNLSNYLYKLNLEICENTDLSKIPETADVFIEGWSFMHSITENKNDYKSVFDDIYHRICELLKKDGKIILIESLGTNVIEPTIPNIVFENFYLLLENEYGFKKNVIKTDYQFPDFKEADRIMSFFFGDWISSDIMNNKKTIIPEFTGIWVKDI
jgi:hypothetical protein